MDLAIHEGTATSDAARAIAAVEHQVRERYPMTKRLFIEAGSGPLVQRWSRPDAIRGAADVPGTA